MMCSYNFDIVFFKLEIFYYFYNIVFVESYNNFFWILFSFYKFVMVFLNYKIEAWATSDYFLTKFVK